MKAIDEVKAGLENRQLGGRVEKTYHQLLKGYWWFPESGENVYLGASKDVALVVISVLKRKSRPCPLTGTGDGGQAN
ncbi:MAG: hypothetical protein E3J21_08640 [Anaerolineales bacterium]|nr:MAG: hypothetical protein E3J21_08640 [Anaerolineales bacterium]